jgi:hypothetical protein
MKKLIIDYEFNALEVQNSVGTDKIKFQDANLVAGPGNTTIGNYSKALYLSNSGKAEVEIPGLQTDLKKFCLQVAFKVNAAVSSRQNIMESDILPFSLFVMPGKTTTTFELVSSVNVKKYGWTNADSKFKKAFKINKWYVASIVYDHDTLGLFVDDKLISVHGFPIGTIKKTSGKKLVFGTWMDGHRNHLNGSLAGFKWYNGIPEQLESLLDESRAHAEWHITYKREAIEKKINTGKRVHGIKFDSKTGSYTQYYEHCGIMYHESVGVAFEMHGAIYAKFKSMAKRSDLGYLTTDESNATKPGAKKNLFSNGGIYWSGSTGAVPVLGYIYLEYENLGESKAFGLPLKSARSIPGGKEQEFQGCRIFYKNGAGKAHEVHGAILAKYLKKGSTKKLGFPITNESDIKKGNSIIGKFSEFEHATIYWKSGIGAFEVHGLIRDKYQDLKGPLGEMGFPTSDEVDIPNYSGTGRINTFEKGSLLWFGTPDIVVARPFKIFLKRIHTKEDEGCCRGQNDIYFRVKLKKGATTVHNKRYPHSGDYGDHNIIEPNITFPVEFMPNKLNQSFSFYIDVWDSDQPTNADDHLGRHTTVLNAANAWGYRDVTFNQHFSKVKSLLWSIKPQININALTEIQKWWKFGNFGTPKLSYGQYAAAFRDVDSETEWWDITDWLEKAFYSIAVKGIASGGNCFGMSLESIYCRKNRSLFGEPLNIVPFNNTSKNEINIKHAYQVGAAPIWWFLGQFVSGNTHDPKDVFFKTREAFSRGDNPVLCVSQNYNFSGSPHAVMPVRWNTSASPWEITVMDPNAPGRESTLYIDPHHNTYSFQSGSARYSGGEWSGGRLHYMPYHILNTRQRTPIWDAILLLLAGTILIIGDDTETASIKDGNGLDLDASGTRARNLMKNGYLPDEFFVSYVGLDSSDHLNPGQFMLRREKQITHPGVINEASLPTDVLMSIPRFTPFRRAVAVDERVHDALSGRSVHNILNDDATMALLPDNLKGMLENVTKSNNKHNFEHKIKGRKNGQLQYVIKRGLSEININSNIQKNEVNTLKVSDLSTNANKIEFISPVNKTVSIDIVNKIGVNGDYIKMTIGNIPATANKAIAVNVKQGISGVELENKDVSANLSVKLDGKIDGKQISKNYSVPFKDAVRIKPATSLYSDHLMVSDIKKLFGTVISSKEILKLNQ